MGNAFVALLTIALLVGKWRPKNAATVNKALGKFLFDVYIFHQLVFNDSHKNDFLRLLAALIRFTHELIFVSLTAMPDNIRKRMSPYWAELEGAIFSSLSMERRVHSRWIM